MKISNRQIGTIKNEAGRCQFTVKGYDLSASLSQENEEVQSFNPVEFNGNANTRKHRILDLLKRSSVKIDNNIHCAEIATITWHSGFCNLNISPAATVKESLTVQKAGGTDPNTVVRNFRTSARVTARVAARVTGQSTSRLQKYRLTEKGRLLLEQLDKDGGRI